MIDLLYADEHCPELAEKLKAKFPAIKTELTYDDIHGQRLSVDVSDADKREYLKFIITEGYGTLSFHIEMTIQGKTLKVTDPDFDGAYKELESILAELDKSYPKQ